MSNGRIAVVVLSIVILTGCAVGPRVESDLTVDDGGWTLPLQKLGINGQMASLAMAHPWEVKQVSSYDPTGGNNDDAFAVEIVEGEVVLADLEGPGCVLRTWTRNPWGTLMIFVDDMDTPIIITDFQAIFGGDLELHSPGFNLFSPPLSGESGGGYFSYVPIPYKERCRIIAVGDVEKLAYQINYAEFSPDTDIRSFSPNLTAADMVFFRRWKNLWERSTQVRFVERDEEEYYFTRRKIWANKNAQLLPLEGPGTVREIEMMVRSRDADVLEKVWIVIYFDGQEVPNVLAPLGQFFGVSSMDGGDYGGLGVGKNGDRMWCRYPMPFSQGMEIRLISVSDQITEITYSVTWRKGPVDDDLLYFNARYQEAETEAGKPYTAFSTQGSGHFAGLNLLIDGAPSLSFLEGDPVFVIDGDDTVYHGTGTDDYFNGGWYFKSGPFATATHGCTEKVNGAPTSVGAYRTHITDAVPFDRSFALLLEHGAHNDQPGINYSSVAYWYQRGTESEFWPIKGLESFEIARTSE